MYQLMKGIDHMHRNGIFHRDIKPENILILNDALKLADFGSCRGIYSKQPFTEYISTRWYRAPECLLTDGYYNYKMDIWGVGCVFFEIMSLYPLFPGNNELDQIHKIHNIMGTPPTELLNRLKKHGTHMDFDFPVKQGTGITKLLPHASPEALDLMMKLLTYNPDERPSAKQALRHPYFKEIRELDKKLRKQKTGGVGDDDDLEGDATIASQNSGNNNTLGQQRAPEDDTQTDSRLPPLPGGGTLPALAKGSSVTETSKGSTVNMQSMKASSTTTVGALPKVPTKEEKSLPKLVPIAKK
jgi:renal tumor antigen